LIGDSFEKLILASFISLFLFTSNFAFSANQIEDGLRRLAASNIED